MRIFYELLCTVIIEIVLTSYLKNVPAKFQIESDKTTSIYNVSTRVLSKK